jgi:hypothetical protein
VQYLHFTRKQRIKPNVNDDKLPIQKQFWNIPSAASHAGYSARQFRRIIEKDQIPVMQIGHRFFILNADFVKWSSTRQIAGQI